MQYCTVLPTIMGSQTIPSEQIYLTLDTTSGFSQMLGVLILTLVVSEALCLFFLHLVSKITWYSFYADFHSQLFMMEITAAEEAEELLGIKEQMPTLDKEELDEVLITTTWSCGSNMHYLACNDEGVARCAICLCDYEQNDSISRSKCCEHKFHTSCYKQWLMKGNNGQKLSCPYCRCAIFRRPSLLKGTQATNTNSENRSLYMWLFEGYS